MSEVVIERYGAVLVCRLNRPQDRNGLTGALLAEYLAALEEARTDAGVRVVVDDRRRRCVAVPARHDRPSTATHATLQGNRRAYAADSSDDRALEHGDPARSIDWDIGAGNAGDQDISTDALIAAVNGAATAGGGCATGRCSDDIRRASDARHVHQRVRAQSDSWSSWASAIRCRGPSELEAAMRHDVHRPIRSALTKHERSALCEGCSNARSPQLDETMAYAEQVAAQATIAVQFAKRTLARSLDNSFLAQLELEWPYQVAAFDTDDREGRYRGVPRAASAAVQRTLGGRQFDRDLCGTAQFVALVEDRDLEVHQVSRRITGGIDALADHPATRHHRIACIDRAEQ